MRAIARFIAADRAGQLNLVVDLAREPIGPRWFRGAGTLALLCGTAIALAPGLDPFATPAAAQPTPAKTRFQMNAMLSAGQADAAEVAAPVEQVLPEDTRPTIASNEEAVRIQGSVTEGLYWSLREAGVPSQIAADYLRAVGTRIDVGSEVAPFDRFDLVVAKGRGGPGPLLYAGLRRFQGDDVELMKWNSGGSTGWFDAEPGNRRSDGLMAPVAGRITSGFGMRYHPILRFGRMHSGVDFGASWGSPIVAATDGQVIGAGWNGGYGRQVRVAHDGGIVTTYSHMSAIAAAPGQVVRQGEVIGYVGSTGLSTGPHLHFEVHAGGRAVNPLAVRLASRPVMNGREMEAFKARLKRLMSIGAKAA